MKRILFSMAIVAVAASCSQNEVFDIAQTNVIGFSTLNDRVTKAANDAEADYQVYAELSEDAEGWYIDDVIDGTENTAAKGLYYWPTTEETLSFYAYAPSDADVDALTYGDEDQTFTYTVPDDAQEDFTVAEPLTEYSSTSASAYADFEFAHMLSKITVKVKLADEGDYELESNYDLIDAWTAEVSVFETTSTVDITAGTSTATISSPLPSDLTAYSDERVYYITPQATVGCKIQLKNIQIQHTESGSYLYGEADTEETYSTTETDGTQEGGYAVETPFAAGGVDLKEIVLGETAMASGNFAQGKHYVVTITIGGNAVTEEEETPVIILFSAEDAGWDEEGTTQAFDQPAADE